MLRFLADANLDEGIVSGCRRREPTMDFMSAKDAKLEGVSGPDVLRIAAERGRILVSHDFKTMPHHFGHLLEKGRLQSRRPAGEATHSDWLSDRRTPSDLDCDGCRRVEESYIEDSALRWSSVSRWVALFASPTATGR
jgi:hypothetical protein